MAASGVIGCSSLRDRPVGCGLAVDALSVNALPVGRLRVKSLRLDWLATGVVQPVETQTLYSQPAYRERVYTQRVYSQPAAYRTVSQTRTTYYSTGRHHKRSWEKQALIVGGSAGAGAAIGAIAGGGKGAGIGALSGGFAGLIYNLATRNR